MAPALVLCDRGGGTTTFLGLFYAALVRWGTGPHEGFRVHATHETLRGIRDVYASLVDGHFPSSAPNPRADDLSFVLGYGAAARWLPTHRPGERALTVHVSSVEELAELKDHSFVTDGGLRSRLASHVAIVLVDASRLPPDPAALLTLPHHGFRRFDGEVAACLGLLATYLRTERSRQRATLQPVFVLTKADLLPGRLPGAPDLAHPPPAADLVHRSAWIAGLLGPRMPLTWGLLSERRPGIRFAPALGFLSSVAVEGSGQGEVRVRRRLRLPEGGFEPDYPYEEFATLIDLLQKHSDPAEELLAA